MSYISINIKTNKIMYDYKNYLIEMIMALEGNTSLDYHVSLLTHSINELVEIKNEKFNQKLK